MHTPKHPTRHAVAVAIATGALIAGVTAAPAFATRDHAKPRICHPVEGKGQTGTGWTLENPDEASKHIDEATGAGKHTRKDGRTDVYADAAGLCPGVVVIVPTPTVAPDPTPDPTPTVTASPDPTPTDEPTPDPTPTDEPSHTPTAEPTPSDEPTTEPTPTPSAEPTPTDEPSVTPTTSSTASPVARHAAPVARAELAQTGAETWHLVALAILLLIVGVGAVTWARIVKEGMQS